MSTEPDITDQAPSIEATVSAAEPAATPDAAPATPAWPDWAPAMPEGLPEALPRDQAATFDETVAAIDMAARSPMDYRLPPLIVADPSGEASAEEMQAITGIRSLMWHAALPEVEGNGLMSVIVDESRRLGEQMSDADFAVHEQQSEAALRRVFGERYEPLRERLEGLFEELGRNTPGGSIEPLLEANWHVLISPLVMSRLLHHVERLDQRRRR